MTYYINPWTFYFIEFIRNLDIVNNFCWIICSLLLGGMAYKYFTAPTLDVNCSDYVRRSVEHSNAQIKHKLKIISVIWSIFTLLLVIIPSEKVMYRMLVASYFTKETTQEIIADIDEATNKIIDKIIKAREKK